MNLDRARAQHAVYVEMIRKAGWEVRMLAPDTRFPDACFVEDTAVVQRGRALLTRSGAPSRRGEVSAVAEALPDDLEIFKTPAPACLDGGDVLCLGDRLFVGCSGRTNAKGVSRLAAVFEPVGLQVIPVRVQACLHLKCHASSPRANVLVATDAVLPELSLRDDQRRVQVPPHEAYAANVLGLGTQTLVHVGFPQTIQNLKDAGLDPTEIDMSEFRRADGSLTCLSVLVPA